MLAHRFRAPAPLFFCLFAWACTTPDVDPSDQTRAQTPSPTPTPTTPVSNAPPPASTWVARANPELQPSTGAYAWKNVVVLGGGFVSGVVFGPGGTAYARTDVGGAYRWDDGPNGATDGHWVPLLDWAGHADSNLMGVESVAPDPSDDNTVYVAVGEYVTSGNGQILASKDLGTTWTRSTIGAPMGGNTDGRSMGERLAVDPNLGASLYFGSRTQGLWHSGDSAATWQPVGAFPVNGDTNIGLSLVLFDPRSAASGSASSTIYVGVASTTGPSLYRSKDSGATWAPVPAQPLGVMPHHAGLDSNGILYLSYGNAPGPNSLTNGAVWKVDTGTDTWTDITPLAPDAASPFGYGGLALDPAHPGTLLVSTLDYWRPDRIFRSTNGGQNGSWVEVGAGSRDVAGAQYIYWHEASPINGGTGWAGSIAIDPVNPARAIYGTGQGLWWSDDLGTAKSTHWAFRDFGLEETVPLAIVSPPSGPPLLSGLGDVAGFRHDDLDAPAPSGMFDNPIFGNTTSIDFAEGDPTIVARVGTSSGGGGRGALSVDGGATWAPFATEPAANNGSGTVAVSADGSVFLWVPRRATSATQASFVAFNYSADHGATWHPCAGIPVGSRGSAISDRGNALEFYALVNGTSVYTSTDGAQTFTLGAAVSGGVSLHAAFGQTGDLWLVANDGLYRSLDAGHTFTKLRGTTAAVDLSFGKPETDGGYPTLYLAGTAGGDSGILRSTDTGVTWTRIDDDAHQFGYVSHLSGDPRVYGRVYLGTGGRGIIYGDARTP